MNVPNHRRATRRFFGFEQGEETYNAELTWTSEKIGLFATGIFGRPDLAVDGTGGSSGSGASSTFKDKQGFALSGNYFLMEKNRVGGSYRYLSDFEGSEHTFSAFTIFSLSEHFYILAEGVFQSRLGLLGDVSESSFADIFRVNWEVYKGIHIYFIQELYRADTSDENSDLTGFGGGLQLFPRPHWEIQFEYQKKANAGAGDLFGEFIFYVAALLFLGSAEISIGNR